LAVRLKDIAQELGVSVVTVSKVLRGRPDIGEETRRRVLRRMQELNYRPNMVARGLVIGRTYAIGLIVPDLVQPYFAELARSISGVLRDADRALILASSQGDPAIEQSEMRTLLQRGVDVLLIASCQTEKWSLEAVREAAVPCILVDRNLPKSGVSFVGIDDFRAGAMATEHLALIGKTRIAHIAGGGTWPSAERLRGYQAALLKHSLEARAEYVVATSGLEEDGDSIGYESMRKLLRSADPPDAVFCYNDMAALGAMYATAEQVLNIPSDIAFVGCGNVGFSKYLRYPLTSVDQSVPELGRIAGELALLLDEKRERAAETVLLEPKLVVRTSTVEDLVRPAAGEKRRSPLRVKR
jgi:LacI family transcriptional regulator